MLLRTVAIVQARMGSTRLPAKVLKHLQGTPMLLRVIERLRASRLIHETVIATSVDPGDDRIAERCETWGISCYRGSELDVLDRYYGCAIWKKADIVVRITSDCPLIDPVLVDRVLSERTASGADYASNSLHCTWPRGLDTEVFTMGALERAWREAGRPYEREHVTPFFYQHPELFSLCSVENGENFAGHRWTVDTPEDFELVDRIYAQLDGDGLFSWQEVLDLVRRQPEISAINASIKQKAVI